MDEVLTYPQSKAKNVDNFAQYFRKRTVLKPDTSRISEKKLQLLQFARECDIIFWI